MPLVFLMFPTCTTTTGPSTVLTNWLSNPDVVYKNLSSSTGSVPTIELNKTFNIKDVLSLNTTSVNPDVSAMTYTSITTNPTLNANLLALLCTIDESAATFSFVIRVSFSYYSEMSGRKELGESWGNFLYSYPNLLGRSAFADKVVSNNAFVNIKQNTLFES